MTSELSPQQKNQRPCERACHTPCLMIRQIITIILWPIFWLVNDWVWIPSQRLKILFIDLLYRIALKELAFVLGDSQIALMMDVCFGLLSVHLSCSLCAYMSINTYTKEIYLYKYTKEMVCFHDIPFRVLISSERCFFLRITISQAEITEADRKKLPKVFEIKDSLSFRAMG